ncbi:hypothetical protein FB451DRAFT_1062148 [Mycena latifolia]|nr:hypothetical protein FB451DRAFT_1065030 [Mycena latifolia]KAJ7435880.1 hypothetical protein FB451DRAFT_1062148 [Mycena latifolia]
MDSPPIFPLELEREIFETTALVHPSTIPGLLRVARRIHIWIEPFLYRLVHVGKDPPYSAMGSAILRATKSKPASFFHSAVRHLVLDTSATWTLDDARGVLKLCTRLDAFNAWGDFSDPTLLRILEELPLRRLSIDLDRLFGGYEFIDLTHTLFVSLTHLDIVDAIYENDTRIIARLPMLPALTHLRLNENVPWKHVQRLLVDCPRLEVLINVFPRLKAPWAAQRARTSPIQDPRFVITVYRALVANWTLCQCQPNSWSLAEEFVACRRSGVIHRAPSLTSNLRGVCSQTISSARMLIEP